MKLTPSYISVTAAQGQECVNKGRIQLKVKIRAVKTMKTFHVIEGLQFQCIIEVDFLKENEVVLNFSSQTLTLNKESKIVQPVKPEISFAKEVEKNDLNEVQRGKCIIFLKNDSDLFSDKLAEFNRNIEHSQNVVADTLSLNPQSLDIESKTKVR